MTGQRTHSSTEMTC